MTTIETPTLLEPAACGPVKGQPWPQTAPVFTETWHDLMAIHLRPGVGRLMAFSPALPETLRLTGDASLMIGSLESVRMHRGGETYDWRSFPLVGGPVAWMTARVSDGHRAGHVILRGWSPGAALAGLVPASLRIAQLHGEVHFTHGHGAAVLAGRCVEADTGHALAYELDPADLAVADGTASWADDFCISGAFNSASGGSVRMEPRPVMQARCLKALWVGAPSGSIMEQLLDAQRVRLVDYLPGLTQITRGLPQSLSGAACLTAWSNTEPSSR